MQLLMVKVNTTDTTADDGGAQRTKAVEKLAVINSVKEDGSGGRSVSIVVVLHRICLSSSKGTLSRSLSRSSSSVCVQSITLQIRTLRLRIARDSG
nr:hypothetical protein Iba_chr13bCG11950 [Ipomoea batatas]GMD80597.1 hypothetical protein Iba_chr13eCG3430 [Ipomoea batatas]